MSSVTRQENLFAAESWKVAYKAYQNISYQAYDYDTIRAALVEYVKINFPENFIKEKFDGIPNLLIVFRNIIDNDKGPWF